MSDKTKRTWSYLQPPAAYSLPPCECGNTEAQWSEYVGHLWCEKCQKDFVPSHGGIFDGPIPARLAALMGVKFDRVILATGKVVVFDVESDENARQRIIEDAARYSQELPRP